MHSKEFVVKFGIFSIISLVLILISHLGSSLSIFTSFSLCTFLVYFILTIMMYLFANNAKKTPDTGAYTSILLSFHWIRIFTSLIFILTYINIFVPKSNLFLLPFFTIYILFTIFEVYMLTKMETHV